MGATTKVIDLAELRDEDDFPPYVAIRSSVNDNLEILSPRVMRWSDQIVLFRLDDCRRFWLEQKKKLRCKLSELFDPLLRYHYGDDYLAVFASHPWQCLLYLQYQSSHRRTGLFLLQSRLDQNIFRSIDWDCWFDSLAALPGHWLESNARGFNADAFRARTGQLRRFIERSGVRCPSELSAAVFNAMMRRFGKWLALAWQWSFTDSSALQSFPWRPADTRPRPSVTRELEYPVNQWVYVEQLLREDLERLNDLFPADDSCHINRISWQITLFNYQQISVELSFRHPYSLRRDMPEFETALYQARYIFDDLMRRMAAREQDLDLPETMPLIGWRIELSETIQLAPQLWDLFADQLGEIDYRQVLSLQNKLPTAFECFHLNTSFLPEVSFRSVPPGHVFTADFDTSQWESYAADNPLFFYPEAIPLDSLEVVRKIFLGRSSEPWWLAPDLIDSIRDYFQIEDRNGRRSWAYRTANGSWFKQGEYS